MKVVHLCLGCFFPDNYSYQENMLPKFHKQLGYEVEVIASLISFDKNGKGIFLKQGSSYINEYGIPVTRLENKKPIKIYRKLKRYRGTYEALKKANPDILFIHGCQFLDMDIVVKYLKNNPQIKVYVDNHADFSNSATNFISKNILHKILWRYTAHIIEPFTTQFYGVLPARVEFLKKVYKIPPSKVSLLVMGADDEKIIKAQKTNAREYIRKKYQIKSNDFLLMTGGKIDKWKTQTLLLMEAVSSINHPNIKLIVFGSVTPELKEQVLNLTDGEKVQYIGWIPSEESYEYWSAADLVVFPGRHSVFWEQVAGMGIPMICKYWEGTTHIDMGGNVAFLKEDNVQTIKNEILRVVENPDIYESMKTVANIAKSKFSYKDIANRSIKNETNY